MQDWIKETQTSMMQEFLGRDYMLENMEMKDGKLQMQMEYKGIM
jgi:hypothetical protein